MMITTSTCKFCGKPIKWHKRESSFGTTIWTPLQMVPGKKGGFKLYKDSFGMTERHKCELPEIRHFSANGQISQVFCGQTNGDGNRDYNGSVMSFSDDWSKVTCKKCLDKKAREEEGQRLRNFAAGSQA